MELESTLPLFWMLAGLIVATLIVTPSGILFEVSWGKVMLPTKVPSKSVISMAAPPRDAERLTWHLKQDKEIEGLSVGLVLAKGLSERKEGGLSVGLVLAKGLSERMEDGLSERMEDGLSVGLALAKGLSERMEDGLSRI